MNHTITLFSSQFKDRENERLFRQYNAPSERFQGKWFVLITVLLYLLFLIVDQMALEDLRTMRAMMAMRLVFIALSLPLVFFLPRLKESGKRELLLFCWLMLLLLTVTIDHHLRPEAFLQESIVWEMILILTIFTIFPIRIPLQGISALALSVSSLLRWLVMGRYSMTSGQILSYFIAYGVVNLCGYFIAWQLNRIRRNQYQALLVEQKLKRELEKSIAEISVLQGLIPICANCKSIRDDNGYWESVEAYLGSHYKAVFSHGICPSCAEKLYPDHKKSSQ